MDIVNEAIVALDLQNPNPLPVFMDFIKWHITEVKYNEYRIVFVYSVTNADIINYIESKVTRYNNIWWVWQSMAEMHTLSNILIDIWKDAKYVRFRKKTGIIDIIQPEAKKQMNLLFIDKKPSINIDYFM